MRSKLIYLQQVKQQNMSTLLRLIWQTTTISRIELAEKTGLTSGTVTNLISELISRQLIQELDAVPGAVGRRRISLGFNRHKYRLLGLDLGRASYELIELDLSGAVRQTRTGNLPLDYGPERTLLLVLEQLQDMLGEIERDQAVALGLGIGLPGPMDTERGVLLQPPNYPGWHGYPILDKLSEQLTLPIWIEDDAKTSALAERWYGAGRDGKDLVFVTMGMGIGGGVISGGAQVRSKTGTYSQVGHMVIEPHGLPCACGNRGCWETLGSIPALLKRWGKGEHIEQWVQALADGEEEAQISLRNTLEYLEIALANIYMMYGADTIVLGGKLFPYIQSYMDQIVESVRVRTATFGGRQLQLEASSHGASQSAVGGAALVFDHLLSSPMSMLEKIRGER